MTATDNQREYCHAREAAPQPKAGPSVEMFGNKEANMSGIHHVTAISGDPAENLRFYTRDLGLRFVKKTVNFDDPSTYHLYFGDEIGQPGTILTFFPWQNADRRPARRWRNQPDRVPCTAALTRLLDGPFHREGNFLSDAREAFRRDGSAFHRPRRHGTRDGRHRRCRE